MSSPRVWLITGASSGFGLCMTRHVLSKGDIAIATLRRPSVLEWLKPQYPESQLLILKLDVTISSDITAAFAKAKERFGRIDVVFNNAGYCIVGETEATPEKMARELFEVNFWGADRVNREAVRFFREENGPGRGGRILVHSSYYGIHGSAGAPYYSASKHALEGGTKAFQAELDPAWNIKMTLIEPGFFTTNLGKDNVVVLPIHPAYQSFARTQESRDEIKTLGDNGHDSVEGFKMNLNNLSRTVEEYAHWSNNLEKDEVTRSKL
ncbi:short-chain dehydrogenases/reductases (SDR) family protein [Abortiporus biennis]